MLQFEPMKQPFLSFVIPAKNEEDSVGVLTNEIENVVQKYKYSYEVIFIDDGSTDKTYDKLVNLHKKNKNIKIIKHRGNWGKSIALQNGFEKAQGEIVFTMDADLQDDPIEIPRFLKKLEEGFDLVSGWKKTRHDPISKVIPSRIINFIASFITQVPVHDTNCGYKAYRCEVTQNLNLYGELYRFIPIIAAKQNFKFAEISVHHRTRKYGSSKYGWSRGIRGILDLLTIIFLTGFSLRPGHFFGSIGITLFSIGFLIGLYITYLRLMAGTIQDRHPLLFLGILLIIVGIQSVTTGLLAEMLVSLHQKRESTSRAISQIVE